MEERNYRGKFLISISNLVSSIILNCFLFFFGKEKEELERSSSEDLLRVVGVLEGGWTE